MDVRTGKIKDLEAKRQADIKTRNRLLEGLGEALLQRIGDEAPFNDGGGDTSSGNTPAGALAEYRGLRKEIAASEETICALEKETARLKELEAAASTKEEETIRLKAELEEAYMELGKILLEDPGFHDAGGAVRQQEENLLAKIDEHELKLEELERRGGGVFAWLGKSAQATVSKTLLLKNRSALQKLYRAVGEKYISSGSVNFTGAAAASADTAGEAEAGEAARAAEKANELKALLSSLAADISDLKAERRKISEKTGADGSLSRRIQGLEKQIVTTKEKLKAVYARMGSFAAEDGELFSAFLRDEDAAVLENAGRVKGSIEETERAIERITAAMRIDTEHAEIEKAKKAISAQREKIAAAEAAIAEQEKLIAKTERHIEELRALVDNNSGA